MKRGFDFIGTSRSVRLVIPAVLIISTGLASCDAYNKGFNRAFDKSLHDSCVKSAIEHSAPSDKAESYCSCMVSQLQDLTVQEKQSLDMNSPKVQQATAHCRAQTP